MAFGTKTAPAQAPAMQKPQARWGDPGVSEGFFVQDTAIAPSPNFQNIPLADAGILSELRHHIYGTATVTHGTGTNAKDVWGPYSLVQQYKLTAGTNTPLVYLGAKGIEVLQIVEYPELSPEAVAVAQTVANPLANTSDFFNYPATTGTLRFWFRIPVALKWNGMPGGEVAHLILQNKKIANIITPTFGLAGSASPWNAASGSGFGSQPYNITGNDTVTFAGTMETWKKLYTVPDSRAQYPVYGFVRYLSETTQPYSGSGFTYNFEPGGVLLRAYFWFVDATAAGGMATANMSTIAYQYGTNKQLDVWSPYANIHHQLMLYGRPLPQGCFAFDYYTKNRSLVDAKSTENVANVQVTATLASGYSVPANSYVAIILDKVYIVQNYLGN